MKKIMIAAFTIAFAAIAQAATINWSNGFGLNAYNQPGDEGAAYNGTIYLMVGGSDAANAFMTTVLAAEGNFAAEFSSQVAASIASMAHTGFELDPHEFDTTALDGLTDFYVVAIDESNRGIYMSEVIAQNVLSVGTSYLEFSHDAAYENAAFGPGSEVSGAGWYTAVPEPTSALMLLVGLAGLALKRKVA